MENKDYSLSRFTKQYQNSKTVRFALTPIGQTEEYIIQNQYIEAARRKNQAYKIVKPIIDERFRSMIDDVLTHCEKQDWATLDKLILQYQNNKCRENMDALAEQQEEIRKNISEEFAKSDEYKNFFGKEDSKKLFKTFLPEYLNQINASESDKEAVNEFQKFKTYFSNFLIVRADIFKADNKHNTIPYRIVNENFMIFAGNKRTFSNIIRLIPNALEEIAKDGMKKEEWSFYNIQNIDSWFEPDSFQMCMSQRGIQKYNFIIGLVNSYINLYTQQNPQATEVKRSRLKLRMLHKQILSDRVNPSWLPEQFEEGEEGEKQIYEAILALENDLTKNCFDKKYDLLLQTIDIENPRIYIAASEMARVSSALHMGWNGLNDVRKTILLESDKKQAKVEKILKQDVSLKDLSDTLNRYADVYKKEQIPSLYQYIEYGTELLQDCAITRKEYHDLLNNNSNTLSLNQNEKLIEGLKAYLDSYQAILHFLNVFIVGDELDKDTDFYAELDGLVESLSEIVPLYNKIRNYITRKVYSLDKMRIMFERSDFLGGWGQSFDTKEALLFQKDNLYHIGIIEKKYTNTDVEYLYEGIKEGNRAIRFIYNFQKADNKNIPRTFIRSKGTNYAPAVRKYNLPIESIIDIYDAGKFKTNYKKINEKEYYESLEKLIDYFKDGILKNENYKKFHFNWKPSNEYENINEFYNDTNNACFLLEKEEINYDHLKEQANQGKIYLFQISSKDFNEGSKETPNLQTMYWRELFSDQNCKAGVIKLCGGASIYMRDASINQPVIHRKDSWLINKWYKVNGQNVVIPDDTYVKFTKIAQERMNEDELTLEERQLWNSGLIQKKKATHDITKDRRFTKKQYMLHAPLTINYKQQDSPRYFNEKVRSFLKDNPDINIIGIDRGEKNLIYITIIDQKGNILNGMQKSFNQIEEKGKEGRTIDYYSKLESVEARHDTARKNWKQIGTIRELKEGYLSQVVHEITQLMIQYNAVIVMENLNMGFKKGRMKVEKSVYQKFEKMLIDKMNYLAFKRDMQGNAIAPYEVGGVMNGYQLTDRFTSFADMGNQNGFIFYVPAAYTSVIDPVTGFVNVFQKTEFKTNDFLHRFDNISWNDKEQSFVFTFDYQNFKCNGTCYQNKWSLYADVDRIETIIKNNQVDRIEPCNPNQKLIDFFDKKGITYRDGHNIVDDLEKYDSKTISEIIHNFKLILQLRNSMRNPDTGEIVDYIASPVMYNEERFDSRKRNPELPQDADANGAYHIALKGLMYLQKINEYADPDGNMDNRNLKITNEEWFKYMQTRKEHTYF